MDGMILIRRYKLRKAGQRGHVLTIPEEYIEGAQITERQRFAMYRDKDRLILVPEKAEAIHE